MKDSEIYHSLTWKIGSFFTAPMVKLFPRGSKQREFFNKVFTFLSPKHDSTVYQTWIYNNEPTESELELQRIEIDNWINPPKISIVIPVYNTPPVILQEAIDSVISQTYPKWELCIANGSPDNCDINSILESYAKKDQRVLVKNLESNEGIAGNTNAAIDMASGDFVAFLDHDDLLAPFALASIAEAIHEEPCADLIYSDEDKITEDGATRFNPFFKPAFSPDYLLGINYICHILVIRKSLGGELGWIRNGFEGAQDFDLVLRVSEKARVIVHIPQILYHWRAIPGSTALIIDAKEYATTSGLKAVTEHLARLGIKGSVVQGPVPTSYKVKYELSEKPLVSIIIPSNDHADDLKKCIQSILEKTTYSNYEILIIENNSKDQRTFDLYAELKKNQVIRILHYDQPFNYSEINNFAVKQAKGEVFLFLNNDTEVISPDWIEQMLVYAIRSDIGIVGAKLYYPDNTIQHAGVIIGFSWIAGHADLHAPRESLGHVLSLQMARNLSAVTGACMMVRKQVFEKIGGFDKNFILAFGDVDICLKAITMGYRNVWTPYAELYHFESKTRGYEDSPEKQRRFMKETNYFRIIWNNVLLKGDNFYNPNFLLEIGTYKINPNLCDKNYRVEKSYNNAISTIPNRNY